MSYLLQENGGAILQENGGHILIDANSQNSRLSKIVAWQGRIPFTIQYCVKCQKFLKYNTRQLLYCDNCANPNRVPKTVYIKLKTTI